MKCANCNMSFSTKRELVEHMLDVHNSPFIEGDLSDFSDNILNKRIKDTSHVKNSQSKIHLEKVKYARGDD